MLVSVETVDAILLGDAPNVVEITDWVGDKYKSTKRFVIQSDGKFYEGEVVKRTTEVSEILPSKGDFTKKKEKKENFTKEKEIVVTYSHEENNGVEAYEVTPKAVKINRKRIIQYRRV